MSSLTRTLPDRRRSRAAPVFPLKDNIPTRRFPYLTVAIIVANVLVFFLSMVPTVGASGAVAAVLGGYALLYPRARVITLGLIVVFFTFIELPALLVLGLWLALQVLYGAAKLAQPVGEGGGVAYFAHIGGSCSASR